MSDGNFNRALLPSTPYASGLKVGRAQGRQWAVAAFGAWLDAALPGLSADERSAHVATFVRLLQDQPQNHDRQ